MRVKNALLVTTLIGLSVVIAHVSAQQPAPAPPTPAAGAPQAPPAGRGGRGGRGADPAAAAAPQGGGNRGATFPAGQRPPDDPAIVARGKTLYEANCQLCHGRDLRGGDQGGPNLLRSPVTLEDKMGELFLPIVKSGQGKMQAVSMPDEDIKAVGLYVHSIAGTMTGQGGPPRGNPMPPNEQVLVGDVAAGRTYFQSKCANCHSVTGDLQGIGGRYPDPRTLQSSWVGGTSGGGGRGGGGRGGAAGGGKPTTVTVTLPSGQKVEGRLGRIDDFLVIVNFDDGTQRSFARNGDVPKVEVKNPLQGHYDLIAALNDKDMHNVTAYLASLK
jgi:cytochrome c oxidase cbb3-type subunit 3